MAFGGLFCFRPRMKGFFSYHMLRFLPRHLSGRLFRVSENSKFFKEWQPYCDSFSVLTFTAGIQVWSLEVLRYSRPFDDGASGAAE